MYKRYLYSGLVAVGVIGVQASGRLGRRDNSAQAQYGATGPSVGTH